MEALMVGERQDIPQQMFTVQYGRPGCPNLLLCQILESRGLGIRVGEEKKVYPYHSTASYSTVSRDIFVTTEGESVLVKIFQTPELTALDEAYSATDWKEPQLKDCSEWDDETKRRVKAYYLGCLSAILYQNAELAPKVSTLNEWRESQLREAKGYKEKANALLGTLPPLTPDDIHSLIEQVVDRELALQS